MDIFCMRIKIMALPVVCAPEVYTWNAYSETNEPQFNFRYETSYICKKKSSQIVQDAFPDHYYSNAIHPGLLYR